MQGQPYHRLGDPDGDQAGGEGILHRHEAPPPQGRARQPPPHLQQQEAAPVQQPQPAQEDELIWRMQGIGRRLMGVGQSCKNEFKNVRNK